MFRGAAGPKADAVPALPHEMSFRRIATIERRALAQNAALSTASVLFVFFVIEAGVRLLSHQRGGKEQRETHRYAVYDPVLGWRKSPSREVTFSRRDFVTKIRINSQGLRDRERPVPKPQGEFRVVALGDSFVEAFMMKDEETPSARLLAYLHGPGCSIDVINGGTFGYSTDQEYLAYDRDLYRYQPDVVVLFAYHNDIPPLLWGPDKPVLDFSTEPPRVSNEPVTSRFAAGAPDQPQRSFTVPTPEDRTAQVTSSNPPTAPPFLRSEALAALRERLEATPPWVRDRLEVLGVVPPIRQVDLNDELLLYARQPPDHLRRAVDAFQKTLGALKRRVARDGARLLVAYIPSRFEVNPEDWERTKALHRIGDRRFDRRALVFRLMTAASREDAPFLDLTDALKAARGWFSRPYFATDSHWNSRGADAGARAVAAKLRQLSWLPACRAS